MTDRLAHALARGPVILDAAMGTRLMALGLDLQHDDPCLWNLKRPEAVSAIHQRDVAAGSHAVLTNTFGANRAWLVRFGRANEVEAINQRAAALARAVVGNEGLVIGSIGPTTADESGAYREQADALAQAGVDALLFETHRADSALAALNEVRGLVPFPLLVSLIDWPDPPDEFVRKLADHGAGALGVNCVPGMERALLSAERLRLATSLPLIVKPNAGNPGQPTESPQSFEAAGARLRALGPVLVGGCCGTGEAHVAALRASCASEPPG